uniref:site-specific DNA-methyltransferase (adenine-specific) n=1 Tax=Candidatus Kentrum sp. TUN TaxID=2126343 RepID=A0A451A048_9GAMM|nr:MAG: Methyltransferase domain-containing protein [Candidatus Kentron sp. TUN]
MNPVEIEEAVSELASYPFSRDEFPFAFLKAFGNKPTTIKRLRAGASNKSDVGGVLQTKNIHMVVAGVGEVGQTLKMLRTSPATTRHKARFILATDGMDFEAEDLESGETVACPYPDFPDHFGFFLPLAGITTVRQIRESAFDIRATSRLNRLYVALLKDNPAWRSTEGAQDMNHFMARLIFCFFAEDTDIFEGGNLFTGTIERMSAGDSGNTHQVMGEIFRAMNTPREARAGANLPRWADPFPYVNGGLFSDDMEVPRFGKVARTYLLHIGGLDWTRINPDIFGSMIQAVADDDERGALGMHYTSVPNILKVLNPLFLDDLREKLIEAGDNPRKLLNLRKRLAKIRVFDPACGSGNFLVIAYKEMRAIENTLNEYRGEPGRKSDIRLTNFRGIEIRPFPAEIVRLALIIAEYQCNERYLGQKEALAEFLPLAKENWITCGNALRLDWLSICPPTGAEVKVRADDLFETPLEQAEVDFENGGGETYICGNPPYLGSTWQSKEQKDDLKRVFNGRAKSWKSLDYVAGWFMKAADYGRQTDAVAAFVSTNSICQGQQVPILWPLIFATGHEIAFAHASFKWANLASHNAGVTVAIIGISNHPPQLRRLFSISSDGRTLVKDVDNINAYLVSGINLVVSKLSAPLCGQALIDYGNKPTDGGGLIFSSVERKELLANAPESAQYVRRFIGSSDSIDGTLRYCLWISDSHADNAKKHQIISERLMKVRAFRSDSRKQATIMAASWPHKFQEIRQIGNEASFIIPRHSSETREYLPFVIGAKGDIVADSAFAFYNCPLWNIAIFASRVHLSWVAAVCGKIKIDYRYSNTLGWNTFPVPFLTKKNKDDLTRCAENILLAREAHFPATIAELYEPGKMPEDLRAAHDYNDEVLERVYIGRRFHNDTERLEKLFDLYSKMTANQKNGAKDKDKRSDEHV